MNDEQRKAMFAKQGSKGHGISSGIRSKSFTSEKQVCPACGKLKYLTGYGKCHSCYAEGNPIKIRYKNNDIFDTIQKHPFTWPEKLSKKEEKQKELENKIKEWNNREPWALNANIAKQLGTTVEKVRKVRGLDLLDSEKFGVDWHEEMGHNNMSIHVYTEDQNHTVWALHDPEEISELVEQGWFKWEDKRSILNWLYRNGNIDDYFIKTRKSLNQINKHH